MNIFQTIANYINAISPDRIFALIVGIAAIFLARSIFKKAVTIAFIVIAGIALAYFFLPAFFTALIGVI